MTRLKAQYITDENGNTSHVVLDYDTYKELSYAAEKYAETENILNALADEDGLPHLIDADIVHRLAMGENPVRVWRECRGLKAIELAKAAGISAAYLSEIETGKKDGTFKTMAAIASILDIRLDDLAPITDAQDQQIQARTLRLRAIKDHLDKLTHLIAQEAFDTAAVRQAATKLKSHIEQLDTTDLEEDWLMNAYDVASHALNLIEEAEKNIIHTASLTKEKLVEALNTYSAGTAHSTSDSGTPVSKIFSKKRASSSRP